MFELPYVLAKENARIGTPLATLPLRDPDLRQQHYVNIVAGGFGFFTIDESLSLKLNRTINYETDPHQFQLLIAITDTGRPPITYQRIVPVIVQDTNGA